MDSQKTVIVKAGMLIRKPVNEVFEAMVNPEITSKFWFTRSSGRVEAGKSIEWEWGQFGLKDTVNILEVKPNKLITLNWRLEDLTTTVEIHFEPKSDTATFVKVFEKGFLNTPPAEDKNLEKKINLMLGQNGGWNLVLANMKAWLEYKIDLNLIADHSPQ
ncbi:MAG: SRPBCC family protein [Balneolaceae bacterium]|nr:SRPBCC family protein [Balneolaceae bacterium]